MQTTGWKPYTLGVLSSWQVYEGAAIEPYSLLLMKGVRAAARDFRCRVLLACGVGPVESVHRSMPAWPFLSEEGGFFVPVGPWNTDGLIVMPAELNAAQSEYLQRCSERKFPVVFTGPGEAGPSVMVDNAAGIHQAVAHLVEHGRRNIAFLSGITRSRGDSAQRREAFSQALHAFGLEEDPRRIAAGEHAFQGGQHAMQQILAAGAPCDAVVASNDRSAMGAISVLQDLGYRVPEDVAVIGFDDIAEAKAWVPPLTTLRNSAFAIGYQSVIRLFDQIERHAPAQEDTLIPVSLIVRQSCGCSLISGIQPREPARLERSEPPSADALALRMTEAMMSEVLYTSRTNIGRFCRTLAAAFLEAVQQQAKIGFFHSLERALDATESLGDDLLSWNHAVSILREYADRWHGASASTDFMTMLLDRARLTISERARSVFMREQFHRTEENTRINLMTTELLAALDQAQVRAVIDQHLVQLDIRRMLIVFLQPEDGDPLAYSEVFHAFGFSQELAGTRFSTWEFPRAEWYGDREPVQLALLPLNVMGRVRGYVVFETDRLDMLAVIIHSLEAALRAAFLYTDALKGRRMAEEADQMKSRFLSMVSHELRTPLNVIVGLSELLLRQKDHRDGSAVWQDLERIDANAQHLSRLIGDVLDLASSESGHLRLLREPLDLVEVFRPVIATGEQMAREKGLSWSVSMPEQGPFVMGDQTRLRQVLLNLISNAVKFTVQGEVDLVVTARDREVLVSVRDTGIGIPPAEQSKLFTEFGQSAVSIQYGIRGIGLGLAITKELVERQGGTIGFQSTGQEGRGSTFFFTLPEMPALEERFDAETPALHSGAPVLLLTNQAETAGVLVDFLKQRGYQPAVCLFDQSPNWAAELLAAPPGALILDEALAPTHGWEILSTLKRSEATAYTPVLVCTLDGSQPTGAVLPLAYQLKPLSPAQIARILRQHGLPRAVSTILVVDDDPAIRYVHARLLQEQLPDCRVFQAEDGEAALESIRQQPPDLVLLDLIMPGMDGFAVLETIRGDPDMRDIPVIILTAKVLSEADMARLNRGVVAVLSKGMFHGREILQHIEHALERMPGLGTASQRLVHRAVAYIQAHYSEALTRDQIAEYVHISADHLTDCFHQEMGIPPIAYLNRYRVFQARRLLEEGEQTITRVALEVGFSDSAYFSRVFQREVGVSPRAYLRGRGQAIPGK